MVGGLCVEKHECAEGQLASKSGLCPQNKHLGVECCYEGKIRSFVVVSFEKLYFFNFFFIVPIRPAPCREHLGACMERCNKSLQRPATDCSNGDVCCVLV